MAQGDGQSQLKKGGRLFPAFRQLFQEGNFLRQGIRSNHVPIDADAFGKIYQMGGGEQARDITLCPGQGLNHGAGGAFAIGAGHMDHGGVDTVRPGCRQQFFCVVKPQLDPENWVEKSQSRAADTFMGGILPRENSRSTPVWRGEP